MNLFFKIQKIKYQILNKFDKIKDYKNLYIEILLWAYDKKQIGFTQPELFQNFNLDTNPDIRTWVINVFFTGSNSDRPIIGLFLLKDDGTTNLYSLTDKGMLAAVNYLKLRDAKNSGLWAIGVGVAALVLASISMRYQIQSNHYTRDSLVRAEDQIKLAQKSIDMSEKPQLDFYLKHGPKLQSGEAQIIFGVTNLYPHKIVELKANSWIGGCSGVGKVQSAVGGPMWFDKALEPGENIEDAVTILPDSTNPILFIFDISYKDAATNIYYISRKKFLNTLNGWYTQTNLPENEEIKKILSCAEKFYFGTSLMWEGATVHDSIVNN